LSVPYDECRDPQPHIHVYNLLENVDAQAVLNEFSNRSIYLLDGFYGSCRRRFNCYSQSKYNYKRSIPELGNFTPQGPSTPLNCGAEIINMLVLAACINME